jgi:hypothetical protein
VQIAVVAIVLAFFGYTLRGAWGEALPRLRDADPWTLAAALTVLGAYYLLFVLGWQWILASLGVRIPYGTALQAEMASMLAKYVPGGIWTSLARIAWLRCSGAKGGTSLVLSSILLEGGLSAAAGACSSSSRASPLSRPLTRPCSRSSPSASRSSSSCTRASSTESCAERPLDGVHPRRRGLYWRR